MPTLRIPPYHPRDNVEMTDTMFVIWQDSMNSLYFLDRAQFEKYVLYDKCISFQKDSLYRIYVFQYLLIQ